MNFYSSSIITALTILQRKSGRIPLPLHPGPARGAVAACALGGARGGEGAPRARAV